MEERLKLVLDLEGSKAPLTQLRRSDGISRPTAYKWLKLGITPGRIEPGKPQHNGRHERFHLTLKRETASPPKRPGGPSNGPSRTSYWWGGRLARHPYRPERPPPRPHPDPSRTSIQGSVPIDTHDALQWPR